VSGDDGVPLEVPNRVTQAGADGTVGRFEGSLAGSMRGATVTVVGDAEGALSSLLVPGRYDGTLLDDCVFDVGGLSRA
jgi:hypothetical protein